SPGSVATPPVTTRTGSPSVWASTVWTRRFARMISALCGVLRQHHPVAEPRLVAVDLTGVEGRHEVEHLGGDDLAGHEHREARRVRGDEPGRDRSVTALDAAAQLVREDVLDVLPAQARIVGRAQVAVGQLRGRILG